MDIKVKLTIPIARVLPPIEPELILTDVFAGWTCVLPELPKLSRFGFFCVFFFFLACRFLFQSKVGLGGLSAGDEGDLEEEKQKRRRAERIMNRVLTDEADRV